MVACDLTEHKRTEEELRRSRGKLEIKVKKRTAGLTRASKELQEEIARREKAAEQLLLVPLTAETVENVRRIN